MKQALSSFDRRTTYLSLSGLKIWITHQSICIILYPGWGSEGLRWRKHGEDERGSAEVAVAGKWEVGDNFGWNTFCLVLGKMTHYWLSHERRIVNLWYCIKQILKRSFQMPKFQYPPSYYFSILKNEVIWCHQLHSQNWRNLILKWKFENTHRTDGIKGTLDLARHGGEVASNMMSSIFNNLSSSHWVGLHNNFSNKQSPSKLIGTQHFFYAKKSKFYFIFEGNQSY